MKCVECLSKRAYYNFKDNKNAMYCGTCKSVDMINVISKRCYTCSLKLPSFNYTGLKPKYCKDCKLENMINVSNKLCERCGVKRASFSKSKKESAKFCKPCSNEMNLKVVNVISKKCEFSGCFESARYNNNLNNKAKFCRMHKENKMIDVRSLNEKCIVCVSVKATFNKVGETKAKYCKSCIININKEYKFEYEDVKNKKCKKCLTIRANSKYNSYCKICYESSN